MSVTLFCNSSFPIDFHLVFHSPGGLPSFWFNAFQKFGRGAGPMQASMPALMSLLASGHSSYQRSPRITKTLYSWTYLKRVVAISSTAGKVYQSAVGGNATEQIFLFWKLPGSSSWSRVLWTSSVRFPAAVLGSWNCNWIKSGENRNSMGSLQGAAFLRHNLVGLHCLVLGLDKQLSFLHTENLKAVKWLIPRPICFTYLFFSLCTFPKHWSIYNIYLF